MDLILFGGLHGTELRNYLNSLKQAIAVQIGHHLKNEKVMKDEVVRFLTEQFSFPHFKFHFSKITIEDNHSNHIEHRMKNGKRTKVLIKHYCCIIPFEGDYSILEFRPETFHGHDCKGQILGYKTKHIKINFECEDENQSQFDHRKLQSYGELSSNCIEINKEIDNWNNQLNSEILRMFPLVQAKLAEKQEFNKRNNIKGNNN